MIQPFLKPLQPTERNILTVSQLNSQAKNTLESHFGSLWLSGEISNYTRATSGHWYFSLKDDDAQIRCAMFRFKTQNMRFQPKEGDCVVVKGKVTLYEARGEYQFVADFMEPAGLGDLQQKLNQLMEKLQSQGLFDPLHKKPLPKLPKSIGVITSPTGAAIHDVLTVLQRRCPMIPIIIYPTQVQGAAAVGNILAALTLAEKRNECDVLLITRGGGSLEDLWCFNDEKIAQRMFDCKIPIVAAIGHEVDTTIAELVADLRAATPSAAAELLVPDQQALQQQIDYLSLNLIQNLQSQIDTLQVRLNIARLKLADPEQAIKGYIHRLDKVRAKMQIALKDQIREQQSSLIKLQRKLDSLSPVKQLKNNQQRIMELKYRLAAAWNNRFEQSNQRLKVNASELNAMSPLATLGRGYSIARKLTNYSVVNKTEQVKPGELLSLILTNGNLECSVMQVNSNSSSD